MFNHSEPFLKELMRNKQGLKLQNFSVLNIADNQRI